MIGDLKVLVTSLNDYNIAMEPPGSVPEEKNHVSARHDLRGGLFEALRSLAVDMPFEAFALATLNLVGIATGPN